MKDIANLLARQKFALEQIVKVQTNYKKDPKARKTSIYFRNVIDKVKSIQNQHLETHDRILELLDENLINSPYFTDEYERFESIRINLLSELEELLAASQPAEELKDNTTPREARNDDELKLPRISLPKFMGNYEDWTPFRDLFISLIHNRSHLSKVEKLHYLKCSLSGEAANLLRHLAVTETNYDIGWKLLNERYDNKRVLVHSQFKRLFGINNSVESSTAIKTLLDRTVECVQTLENFSVVDLWQSIIVYMTTQRLPQDTRQLWEQEQASRVDLPSFDDLKTFLNHRFRALEASGSERMKQPRSGHSLRNVHSLQTERNTSQSLCTHCRGPHRLTHCSQYRQLPHAQKFEIVKKNGLCLNCLDRGHQVVNCCSRFRCLKCKKAHHTLLHKDEVNTRQLSDPGPSTFLRDSTHVNTVNVSGVNLPVTREVLLATALVTMESSHGNVTLRALLDQGSQATLITESAVQQLGHSRRASNICVSGIGSTPVMGVKGMVEARLRTRSNEILTFNALIMNKLTNILPSRSIITTGWEQLKGLQLADPYFHRPGKIDMLLGADVVTKLLIGPVKRLTAGPIAQLTRLGWVITGQVNSQFVEYGNQLQSFKIETIENDKLNEKLQKFWEIEEVQTRRLVTEEEVACESHFLDTFSRDDTGRFIVRLPFKAEIGKNTLGCSRANALASFLALEKRLKSDNELYNEYTSCINDYLSRRHMEPANKIAEHIMENGKQLCTAFYLPHHAVRKESSSTSCRIVFDASRKTSSGLSLNDVLMTGPSIQNDLTTVIMRWRAYPYAFAADIAKMYRQVRIHEEDINYQRILWRTHPSEDIKEYSLNTVTFGITSAPFLAIRCLKKLAELNRDAYPNAWNTVENEFYVDDLLSGGHSIAEAIAKRIEVYDVLKSGGFELRKWVANDCKILEGVDEKDIEMLSTMDLNLEQNYNSLGLLWNPMSDQFSYKIKKIEQVTSCSKRQLLSDIARLYDPLGWIAPIIIRAKILLQSLWLHGLSWDEPLSEEIRATWSKLKDNLHGLRNLRIPRWVEFTEESIVELHGFSDASSKAYAAAIYMVIRNEEKTSSHLITAKTKVAPIRPVSIPRLELCGAVLLAKLMAKVTSSLNVTNVKRWLWTDSQIVLAWLKGHPTRWTVFVANRTTTIFDAVGNGPWRHVPTKDNPADLASRGIEISQIINNTLWWHGPTWLLEPIDHWPISSDVSETKIERRKEALVNFIQINKSQMELIIKNYSTLNRLYRVTAYCLRFITLALKRTEDRGYLKAEELRRAQNIWIQFTQRNEFQTEILNLQRRQYIGKNSKLLKLHPFLDGNGILRVGGRLTEAKLAYDAKHPIILPKNGRLVELLIQQVHRTTLHGQTQLMLNVLRRKFWVIDARNSIKREIHKCVKCFRAKPRLSSQLMGSLPSPRVTVSRPFTHTGVDYCGPFEFRDRRGRGSRLQKGYVAVFICLAVKAIHMEFVTDLTTATFLAALKRFMARRGLCSHIYSDRGTNFIGANAELQRIAKTNHEYAAEILANDSIEWHFNPPAAPHFGGLWEAGVKSLKQHMRRVIGNVILTYEEMATVLTQIEACLNSRPLCPLSDDPSDTEVLTPAHFLIGGPLLAPPTPNLLDLKIQYLDRWQLTQRLVQDFWNKWKSEYLTRLQSRPKWLNEKPGPHVGDLCLLKNENHLPYKWPLARIVNLHPGKDSLIRVVTVSSNGKTFTRPIAKIALLPIPNESPR